MPVKYIPGMILNPVTTITRPASKICFKLVRVKKLMKGGVVDFLLTENGGRLFSAVQPRFGTRAILKWAGPILKSLQLSFDFKTGCPF